MVTFIVSVRTKVCTRWQSFCRDFMIFDNLSCRGVNIFKDFMSFVKYEDLNIEEQYYHNAVALPCTATVIAENDEWYEADDCQMAPCNSQSLSPSGGVFNVPEKSDSIGVLRLSLFVAGKRRKMLIHFGKPLLSVRYCSTDSGEGVRPAKLTHLTSEGDAHMVDVGGKKATDRVASASAVVILGPELFPLVVEGGKLNKHLKTIVQVAGIAGAKRTSDLIPLCHNIPISKVNIDLEVDSREEGLIRIISTVKTNGKTGVEMEALTAVTVAALTVYDMCKAVSHDIQITDIKLEAKSGGKLDFKR